MKSIEEFKAKAEFFKAGSIIPQRVLKGPRKVKHLIKFGSDSWVMPSYGGYIVAFDCKDTGSAIKINWQLKNANLYGSPYGNWETFWCGNTKTSDEKWIENINAVM